MATVAARDSARAQRKAELDGFKRDRILSAAREVFAERGLENTTMRQIAAAAGYVAGTLYLHFDSKEAIYAALVRESLVRLDAAIETARADGARAALLSFYNYYAENADELDLGLYLFSGTGRRGLTPELDQELNDRLRQIVEKLVAAYRTAVSAPPSDADRKVVGLATFMVGCLIMGGTGRLGMLGYSGVDMVEQRIDELLNQAG